eukprot:3234361-Lingulodinium_polyedra.AAC.1
MVPRSQGSDRPNAVSAAFHREDQSVGDCSRNCRSAPRRDTDQEGFFISASVLVVGNCGVDADHHAEPLAEALLRHRRADLSSCPDHPVPI